MHFLAFDLGAESGRAMLGTLEGPRLRLVEVHRFDNQPLQEHGHLYWNLKALWENVQTGLKRAAEHCRRLDGIGVDTWGVDYGLLSPEGELAGRPFHYRDVRNNGVMDDALQRVQRERIYEATGIQFLQFNTLFQLMAHARDDPASLQRAQRLLFMPDLINFLLCGAAQTEPTIASTSQMYDPRRHEWATDLLEELGLPARLLPPISRTASRINLHQTVARDCGLDPSSAVTSTTGHDTAAAVAAVPAAEDQDWCYISSGTWSLMGVELPAPIISAGSLRDNFTNEVGFGRSIRFLRNIMGLWLVQQCRREFAARGADYSYGQLKALAAAAAGCDALVDPDDPAFLAPGEMPAKIERFCRQTHQTPPASEGQIIRCCLESLALTYRRTLERLEALIGRSITTIHIVGGGAQNELLNQMTADACGRPVLAGPVEATAVGNLLVQAISVGAVPSLRQLRRIIAQSFETSRFEPRERPAWDRKYERFRELAGG